MFRFSTEIDIKLLSFPSELLPSIFFHRDADLQGRCRKKRKKEKRHHSLDSDFYEKTKRKISWGVGQGVKEIKSVTLVYYWDEVYLNTWSESNIVEVN